MILSLLDVIHSCPHCGLRVSNSEAISMFFGWRKTFKMTIEPGYKLIPQSWCIKCRSKEARRYE